MSNKTSDKNVVTEEDLEVLNEVLLHNRETEQARIAIEHMLAEREQMLKERDVANDSVIAHKFAVMQQQLEQKDKRIQELEEKLLDIIQGTEIINKETPEYVKENYIPKQVIEDKIKDLRNDLKYIDCNSDCSKCFNKEGKALYRGPDFNFCFAYYQIKGLQELLEEGEKNELSR